MINKYFKEEDVKNLLLKYPNLKVLFRAGLLSRRLCKDALGITKWDMDDLYTDLIKYGAIKVLSSSAFRATSETMSLILKMDNEEDKLHESNC